MGFWELGSEGSDVPYLGGRASPAPSLASGVLRFVLFLEV